MDDEKEATRQTRQRRWFLIANEVALLLGVGFVLYGLAVCVLAYFPTEQQRGTVLSTLLKGSNTVAAIVAFYITIATTYLSPNVRRATNAARLVYAPLLFAAPGAALVVRYVWHIWPTDDALLGLTLVAIGVSILRTFMRTVDLRGI